jgi:hypothetical protein
MAITKNRFLPSASSGRLTPQAEPPFRIIPAALFYDCSAKAAVADLNRPDAFAYGPGISHGRAYLPPDRLDPVTFVKEEAPA